MTLLHLLRHKQPPPPSSWQRTPPPKPEAYLDENGRRYRADAPYLLPKDRQEIQRLDYQHFLFRHLLHGNTFAPVDALLNEGCKVLDVGSGTGRWGCEIAATYPRTSVCGFDLENVPRTTSMPLNSQFQQGNLLLGLPFAARQFQYVHQRALVAGIPFEKWPYILGELKRVTSAGGWVESVEMGTTFHNPGPATQQFLQWWAAISATRGIDASNVARIEELFYHSGFSKIEAKTESIPVGSWGGRIGNLLAQDILAGWPSIKALAHRIVQIPPDYFDEVIGCLESEWNTFQTRYEVYFACGQV